MINKFSSLLKTDSDAVIITSPENRRYFTGFNSSDGYLVISKKEAVFFTDSRYIEAATNQITACKCALLKRVNETLAPYLKELNIKNIYLETERLTVAELNNLKKAFDFSLVEAKEEVDEIINKSRAVKTDYEVTCIKKAQKIAEDAFSHILTFIKEGVTEKEIAAELEMPVEKVREVLKVAQEPKKEEVENLSTFPKENFCTCAVALRLADGDMKSNPLPSASTFPVKSPMPLPGIK